MYRYILCTGTWSICLLHLTKWPLTFTFQKISPSLVICEYFIIIFFYGCDTVHSHFFPINYYPNMYWFITLIMFIVLFMHFHTYTPIYLFTKVAGVNKSLKKTYLHYIFTPVHSFLVLYNGRGTTAVLIDCKFSDVGPDSYSWLTSTTSLQALLSNDQLKSVGWEPGKSLWAVSFSSFLPDIVFHQHLPN